MGEKSAHVCCCAWVRAKKGILCENTWLKGGLEVRTKTKNVLLVGKETKYTTQEKKKCACGRMLYYINCFLFVTSRGDGWIQWERDREGVEREKRNEKQITENGKPFIEGVGEKSSFICKSS